MRFENEAIGKVWVNIGIKGGLSVSLTLFGSKGTIKVENGNWDAYIDEGVPERPTGKAGYVKVQFLTSEKPIEDEIGHFVDCVRKGKRPIVDARDGVKSVDVLDAAVKSYRTSLPQQVSKI
jgi:predicted dehydrogenase